MSDGVKEEEDVGYCLCMKKHQIIQFEKSYSITEVWNNKQFGWY